MRFRRLLLLEHLIDTPTKDKNKISGIVLNDIKKDLMRYVNGEVENLKSLIDNEFTILRRSVEDLERKKLYYWKHVTYRIFERRGGLSKRRKYD